MRGAEWVVRHRAISIALWILLIAGVAPFAARLPGVLRGGADAVPGTESEHVTRALGNAFGAGSLYQFVVVVHSDALGTDAPEFAAVIERATVALQAMREVRSVETPWNSQRAELLSEDGHGALMIATPRVASFQEAEQLTPKLRAAIAGIAKAPVAAEVTGSTAMLYDLDQHSS